MFSYTSLLVIATLEDLVKSYQGLIIAIWGNILLEQQSYIVVVNWAYGFELFLSCRIIKAEQWTQNLFLETVGQLWKSAPRSILGSSLN